MPLHVVAEPVPLVVDSDGVARVRGTRVTLDTLIDAFKGGETAEELARQYPTVSVADAYAIVAYYLHHQVDVDQYLEEGQKKADRLRIQIERRFPPQGIRDRLLARRNEPQTDSNAAPCG